MRERFQYWNQDTHLIITKLLFHYLFWPLAKERQCARS